ncbi:hypothetical protein ABVK25_008911 [Lepraria finkii]|uniref:Uncharacterized protein n=1 Tax=Lepraria finkii TaxID=1340010 RepID=A0ABR4AZV1_9LECA
MGNRSTFGRDKLQTLQDVQRTIHQYKPNDHDDVQCRGWQRPRKDKPAEASDPPAPDRPPYGYAQHTMSDPGPQTDYVPGQNSSPPQGSGWPPLPPSQHAQGQYGGPNAQQGYSQPQHGSAYPSQQVPTYQSQFQSPYGQSQQALSVSPPPNSVQYGPYGQGYQSPPNSSGGYHQGNQSSQPYSASSAPHNQGINQLGSSQPFANNSQSRSLSPNDTSQSYGSSYIDRSLGRIASAPIVYKCNFNLPDDGS